YLVQNDRGDRSFASMRSLVRLLRRAWLLAGVFLCALLAVEMLLRLCVPTRPLQSYHLDCEVFASVPWSRELLTEHVAASRVEWHSYVYWRRRPFEGRWIHVDANGIRRSWNAAEPAAERRKRVFFFGGSTMYGSGARDDYTIPSCVAKALAANGVPVEVTNF